MYEIQLGNEYYSKQSEIYRWCVENFGPCGLDESDAAWTIESMFGTTTIFFQNAYDLVFFQKNCGLI